MLKLLHSHHYIVWFSTSKHCPKLTKLASSTTLILFISLSFFRCSKFELVPPPPGWSQQEMEAPFAIPPHLQAKASQLEAGFMDSDMFTFTSGKGPAPKIDVKAVTEYVSS